MSCFRSGLFSYLLAGLMLWLCVILTACSSQLESNVLKVAMAPDIGSPYVYSPKEEQYGGFEVEIAEYLAQKLKRPLKIIPMPWKQLASSIQKKQADIAISAIEKPGKGLEPKELIATEHYYTAYQQLAVPKKDKFTYNLSDLKGKKVAVVEHSVSQLLLEELNKLKQAKIQILSYSNPQEVFNTLKTGKAQAALTERAFAGWFVWREKNLRLTGEPITQETPYVGLMHKDQGQLKQEIDQILKQGFKDPAFKKIFDKWHVSIRR